MCGFPPRTMEVDSLDGFGLASSKRCDLRIAHAFRGSLIPILRVRPAECRSGWPRRGGVRGFVCALRWMRAWPCGGKTNVSVFEGACLPEQGGEAVRPGGVIVVAITLFA